MSRSRNLLAVNHLQPFTEFCEKLGWVKVDTKGFYEVLRMRRDDEKDPLIVHGKLNTIGMKYCAHYTTWGNSQRLCLAYLKSKKKPKTKTEKE